MGKRMEKELNDADRFFPLKELSLSSGHRRLAIVGRSETKMLRTDQESPNLRVERESVCVDR